MPGRINAITMFMACMLICGCANNSTGPGTSYIHARFRNQDWDSQQATATRKSLLSMITITATRNTPAGRDSMLLSMANVAKTGTYQMAMSAANGRITLDGILYTIGADTGESQGEITFTKFGDGRIAGTFNMTVYRDGITSNPPQQVTEGRFDIALAE